ncbi:DNA mismatch repair endonuclease MutL [bacterium]|nr:DNA mismatch repair endonuclease MutL [bacterium]
MGRIKQLSKHLINQIAAGEVIERPASVVKELVENSIDAGATKISIEITNECRNIRVADNGSGIHPDDILLAFSKHATSKIKNEEDLFDIDTLGFRGEALSSIISIAKLSCTTRTKDFDNGTKVTCENSEVKQVPIGCAVGTIMDVKDLFYNIPARLKFLRNPNTEFSYIQEIVQALAIIHPDISIELKKNGKTILKTTAQGDLKRNLKEIFSNTVTDNLKEVLKTDDLAGLKIYGFVSTPDFTRSSKKDYHIYINSRTVKCPTFQKAIDMAYRDLMANGKYPFVVLNLEMPTSDVDVNVHPSKKEVRYKNVNQVFNFIMAGVLGGLTNFKEVPRETPSPNYYPTPEDDKPKESNVLDMFSGQEPPQNTSRPSLYIAGQQEKPLDVFYNKGKDEMYVPENFEVKHNFNQTANANQAQFFNTTEQSPEPEDIIVGQYKNTYILIELEDGLEIVDQHIAEERYNYEKLKSEKEVASQLLFISDILHVSSTEAAIIKENLDKFERFGYGIEFTSDNELTFRKVPQLLAKVNPKEILTDILENIEGDIDGLEEHILKTTACKASVKAGEKLSLWKMQEIIKKWRTTKMPYTCPHGRPINKIIPHKELASWFQRNG